MGLGPRELVLPSRMFTRSFWRCWAHASEASRRRLSTAARRAARWSANCSAAAARASRLVSGLEPIGGVPEPSVALRRSRLPPGPDGGPSAASSRPIPRRPRGWRRGGFPRVSGGGGGGAGSPRNPPTELGTKPEPKLHPGPKLHCDMLK